MDTLANPVAVKRNESSARAYQVDVEDFGVVMDGPEAQTSGIQSAIDAVAARGGGTLTIPGGKLVSGSLRLRSGVHLHFAAGSVLRGAAIQCAVLVILKNAVDRSPVEFSVHSVFILRSFLLSRQAYNRPPEIAGTAMPALSASRGNRSAIRLRKSAGDGVRSRLGEPGMGELPVGRVRAGRGGFSSGGTNRRR